MAASTITSSDTVTIPRELLDTFLLEVEALGDLDLLRSGSDAGTSLTDHIWRVLATFERDAGLRQNRTDAELDEADARARGRARELFRQLYGEALAQ